MAQSKKASAALRGWAYPRGSGPGAPRRVLTLTEKLARKRKIDESRAALEQAEAGALDQQRLLLTALLEYGLPDDAHEAVRASFYGWRHFRTLVRRAEETLDAVGRDDEEDEA